ncbi:hypothetical protein GCM10027176_65570 [Actinoallomurus bryophytorum]|uniref:Uncharacterized protein n=1 Tax=Actinoallomurus bryophytorum TaxID=1490222 RepID=A0A543CGX3_9ACTN|nr:hypothetical protein [Actinoallomurus bryophytorum]TQL96335.1 hypothetical protein FB559_1861 [Actinoallomurus bryophytorum]
MAPEPQVGPNYPWGDQPWPGTEHIKDELKSHPEAKDELWFNQGEFDALMARLKSRRAELDSRKVGGKTARENLQRAGEAHLQVKDFGQWAAARSLYASAGGAASLMLQAYDYFITALDAVIKRMETTKNINTGAEVDNVDAVTFHNILTIDLGANPKPAPPAQAAPPGQPGQPAQPGQPVQPGSYS